jgi:FkbM family methyltransferase
MRTRREVKDNLMASVFELRPDLETIFGPAGPRHVADIGACDGLSSIGYAKMFPLACIVAIEPRDDNYLEIEVNIAEYGMFDKIHPIKCALGSEPKDNVMFFESYGQAPKVKDWDTGNKSSSLLPPLKHLELHPWCKFRLGKCFMVTLDNLLESPFFLLPFDYIHIDVQGAELQVFRGGPQMLSSCKAIWCEVSNVELYKGQASKKDVIEYLADKGFVVIKDTCGEKTSGDCLFVRKP